MTLFEIRNWRRPKPNLFIGDLYRGDHYQSAVTLFVTDIQEEETHFILKTVSAMYYVKKNTFNRDLEF